MDHLLLSDALIIEGETKVTAREFFDVGQLRARIGKLEAIIGDLLDFVDEYSDVVDGDDDGDPEPNQAMSLITMARDVLEGRTL